MINFWNTVYCFRCEPPLKQVPQNTPKVHPCICIVHLTKDGQLDVRQRSLLAVDGLLNINVVITRRRASEMLCSNIRDLGIL